MAAAGSLIDLQELTERFRRKIDVITAADAVDVQIERGQVACVVGPSGCGKSDVVINADLASRASR